MILKLEVNNIITMMQASRGNEEILLRTLALTIRAAHPTRLRELPILQENKYI